MYLKQPHSKKDFERYYQLRWQVLNKPWHQPRGSEKDPLDEKSIHLMAFSEEDALVGVGCVLMTEEPRVRYMAVHEDYRRQGIGTKILQGLEEAAQAQAAQSIILNAREKAIPFYEANGYEGFAEGKVLFNSIKHSKMRKNLKPPQPSHQHLD